MKKRQLVMIFRVTHTANNGNEITRKIKVYVADRRASVVTNDMIIRAKDMFHFYQFYDVQYIGAKFEFVYVI